MMLRCGNIISGLKLHRHFLASQVAILTYGVRNASRQTTAPGQSPPASLIYPEASSTHHSSLTTFLEYAKRVNLDQNSTVFVGTHYEYTVAESLARYGFTLKRIGGASDFGTDLLGTWTPPTTPQSLRILIQCKAGVQRIGPQYVRELEGSFAGAPPGWRGGSGLLALLVSEREATKGVKDALGRSRWPMGYICCSKDGVLRQMLWNQRAGEAGLEGLGVTLKRSNGDKPDELVILKNGKPLPLLKT